MHSSCQVKILSSLKHNKSLAHSATLLLTNINGYSLHYEDMGYQKIQRMTVVTMPLLVDTSQSVRVCHLIDLLPRLWLLHFFESIRQTSGKLGAKAYLELRSPGSS